MNDTKRGSLEYENVKYLKAFISQFKDVPAPQLEGQIKSFLKKAPMRPVGEIKEKHSEIGSMVNAEHKLEELMRDKKYINSDTGYFKKPTLLKIKNEFPCISNYAKTLNILVDNQSDILNDLGALIVTPAVPVRSMVSGAGELNYIELESFTYCVLTEDMQKYYADSEKGQGTSDFLMVSELIFVCGKLTNVIIEGQNVKINSVGADIEITDTGDSTVIKYKGCTLTIKF